MWGVGGLQVHGIRSRRLVYKEAVEVRVMLVASAKSWSGRRASHQPAFMSLTISHTCLPCLPSGRTLLFWSDLFVVGMVVSWESYESSELGRWERYMRVVRCQGGKGGRIVR